MNLLESMEQIVIVFLFSQSTFRKGGAKENKKLKVSKSR
jgi:hypothetical protein